MSANVPVIRLEVGFDAAPTSGSLAFHLDDPATGKLNTNTLAATRTWADISRYCRSISVNRTADRVAGNVTSYSPGTFATVLKNADRRFDPLNLDGPYVSVGATQVEPMRPIRCTAIWGNGEFPLFSGYVDTWGISYTQPAYSEAAVQATDQLKLLAKYDRTELADEFGGGEFTGQRIGRVLDNAGYTGPRQIARGDVQLQATHLGGSALDEVQEAALAEAGVAFADADGTFVFYSQTDAVKQPSQALSQATFGDGGGAELPYVDATLAYDEAPLINVAQIAKAGDNDNVYEFRDEASVTRYLPAVYNNSSLPFFGAGSALAWAQRMVAASSKPDLRFTQMVLRPGRDPARLFPQALGRRIGDRITVRRRPPGGGDLIDRECIIRGIQHTGDPQNWETVFQLSTAGPVGFLALDTSLFGALDTNKLY